MIETNKQSDLISLDTLCRELSVSEATGRNWIRLGKMQPQMMIDKEPYFTPGYLELIRQRLQDEDSTVLKSRRNKQYITGNDMYQSYVSDQSLARVSVKALVQMVRDTGISVDEAVIRTFLTECAVQLLLHDTIFPYTGRCLEAYLKGQLSLGGREFLVDALLPSRKDAEAVIRSHPGLFRVIYYYEPGEDTLGLLYISLKNIGTRKRKGLYFTPTRVVQKICRKLFEKNPVESQKNPSELSILDPCCGTGNFLLQLPPEISFDQIYGTDTDELSIAIARINMSLKYDMQSRRKLQSHLVQKDYLLPEPGSRDTKNRKYDLILGNPPWGYAFSDIEKRRLKDRFLSADGANVESYDVFIEQALKDLSPEGALSFVLPEAMLNVKSHTKIRRILCEHTRFQYLEYLGNAFDKVQCPCIIFQVQKKTAEDEEERNNHPLRQSYTNVSLGMEVVEQERSYTIQIPRTVSPDCFSFLTTDEEYQVLAKIGNPEGKCYLKGHADFALGIVTGDNARYITDTRTDSNEPILKGSDIRKFRFARTDNYIDYKPKEFQQVAPEHFYRAPEKLLYRFICDQLVFAYDNQQTLSLNSCNILIPRIQGLDVKYILAVLNSRILQFYFRKTFFSLKVLRSHIEQLPIPAASQAEQNRIIKYAEELMQEEPDGTSAEQERQNALYDRLDLEIAILYGLDYLEYDMLKDSLGEGYPYLH